MQSPAERCLLSCANGRCESDGQCTPIPATCGNNIVEPGEECDDGNNIPYDACVSCKRAMCNDGFIQPSAQRPEDCELNTSSPGFDDPVLRAAHPVWTPETCSSDCQRKIYTTCRTTADCPPGTLGCVRGTCAPMACSSSSKPSCPLPTCPLLPGFAVRMEFIGCFVECNEARELRCPRGLRCVALTATPDAPAMCLGEDEPLMPNEVLVTD